MTSQHDFATRAYAAAISLPGDPAVGVKADLFKLSDDLRDVQKPSGLTPEFLADEDERHRKQRLAREAPQAISALRSGSMLQPYDTTKIASTRFDGEHIVACLYDGAALSTFPTAVNGVPVRYIMAGGGELPQPRDKITSELGAELHIAQALQDVRDSIDASDRARVPDFNVRPAEVRALRDALRALVDVIETDWQWR